MEHDLLGGVVQGAITLLTVASLMTVLLRRWEERFKEWLAADKAQRMITEKHIKELVNSIDAANKRLDTDMQKLQRDLLVLRAELPEKYVRREDYVRGQSIIESKLDALAMRLENQMLGGRNGND